MSATQVPFRPVARATRMRLFFGLILLVLAGAGLAWAGAGQIKGVEIETLTAGRGPLITPSDGVIIDYVGTLPDGTQFDANNDAPLLVGQVIPGFAEALQKMQPGGRYKIRIPAKLAYGATPPPGSPIPPNSPLDFTITVKQVVPNAANLAGPPQLPPGADPRGAPPQPEAAQGR
jgi:FKBP-type peptidyl-prolyl cis-trans isomerase FkpA